MVALQSRREHLHVLCLLETDVYQYATDNINDVSHNSDLKMGMAMLAFNLAVNHLVTTWFYFLMGTTF